MTRRISSIEVKNNSVYVNGRKARDTEGLIEDIKPTGVRYAGICDSTGDYCVGELYEGTSGGVKFTLLINKEGSERWNYRIKWGYQPQKPGIIKSDTIPLRWMCHGTLTALFLEMAAQRTQCCKDPFVAEWAKSFDTAVKKYEAKEKTIISLLNNYGYGLGQNTQKIFASNEMDSILSTIKSAQWDNWYSYCEQVEIDPYQYAMNLFGEGVC